MQLDPQDLRRYYASLSNEELLEIDRADLVEMAQTIFDEEVRQRKVASRRDTRRPLGTRTASTQPDAVDGEAEIDEELPGDGEKPGWLDEAAEVYSVVDRPGVDPGSAANARDALQAAGIPCYLDLYEEPDEESDSQTRTHRWRVLVPGKLNFRATSVLERDIFNPEFEAEWKTLLETLSDDEVRAMNPEVAFCGLFDKVDRVNRVYDEEIARRGLAD
jgi:hypothetical protein